MSFPAPSLISYLLCPKRGLAAVLVAGLLFAVAWPDAAQAQYFSFGKNRIQYAAHDWQYAQSRHFDVYFYEEGKALADYTAQAAEDAYADISARFGLEIAHRIPIIVYQGHGDFSATNAAHLPASAEGIGGATEILKNRIVLPFTGDYREFRRTLRHELVHAVVNDVYYGGSLQSLIRNNLQLDIPLWFNEGLAEYAAFGWDANADMYVREAVLRNALPDITRLHGFMAYKGGQSVWDYVAEQYGQEKISEILEHLRQSRSVEESFQKATGLSLAELSGRWQRALQEVHFPEVAAREDLSEVATPLVTRAAGPFHTSPALSPQGNLLAFITAQGGRFRVRLARTSTGEVFRTLIDGQSSETFESLRPQTPGLTWSPDGTKIAVVVKSGPSDAVAVVDVNTRRVTRYRIPGIDQILSVDWSPEGWRLALAAIQGAQSDIYVLDLETHAVDNYTHDAYSDLAPTWSPDGDALVFHSDRGADAQQEQTPSEASADGQFDLYRLNLHPVRLEQLTQTPHWDERNAQFGADPERLLFISDRNGIFNLYEKNLATDTERPLTDVTHGITQATLSADGSRAALVSLQEGRPSIYLLPDPFERVIEQEALQPTVWAQRAAPPERLSLAAQDTARQAPSLALATPSRQRGNPFLRDASDKLSQREARDLAHELLAARTPLGPGTTASPALPSTLTETSRDTASDATAYGSVQVSFGNGAPSASHAPETKETGEATPADSSSPFAVQDNRDADGSLKAKKYKLLFSPDLIYGTTGYDALYGVQGLAQMLFSDMMGNHRIFASTNLLVDLRNADYLISYSYLPRRIDWSFSGYHTARLLPDYERRRYFRYRRYGASVRASYPLDKFNRLDVDAGVAGVSQADIGNPAAPLRARAFFNPSVTFTRDVSVPGTLAPYNGHRLAVSLSGAAGSFHFVTLLGDARLYVPLGSERYTLALRASGGASVGSVQQLFYAAGTQNWLNRRFDTGKGLPIDNLSDFAFATPVMPLRGFSLNSQNGTQFGLLNAELRFPLRVDPLATLLPSLPFYRMQGVAFVDAGSIWGAGDQRLTLFRENLRGERVLDDLLVGVGGGVRTLLFGYPLRFDVAWPFDGHRLGDYQLYLSVGFDF